VLIAGGEDRRQELSGLARLLAERSGETALILLPDTGARLADAAAAAGVAADRMSPAGDMREAIEQAARRLMPRAVVLLSPAAPSYNAYRNFEERGEHFAALARAVALRT